MTSKYIDAYGVDITPGEQILIPKIEPGDIQRPGEIQVGPMTPTRAERVVYWKLGSSDLGTGLILTRDGSVLPHVVDFWMQAGNGMSVIRPQHAGKPAAQVDHSIRHYRMQSNGDLPVHQFIGFPDEYMRNSRDWDGYVKWARQLLEPEMIFRIEEHFAHRELRIHEETWVPELVCPYVAQQITEAQGGNKPFVASLHERRLEVATADLEKIRTRIAQARAEREASRPVVPVEEIAPVAPRRGRKARAS